MPDDLPVDYLIAAFEAAIDQFRDTYAMNYVTVLGALEVVKHDLLNEMRERAEED